MSSPIIYPIITPNMNWTSYLREGHALTGERFNKSLDAGEMKPNQDESIIVGLSQFQSSSYLDVLKTIRTSGITLQLLYFVFLCSYDFRTLNKIVLYSGLRGILYSDPETWLIGGNLLEWKKAVINNCTPEDSFETRYFMNCIYVLFQCNGYPNVWGNYGKTQLPDGTFYFRLKDTS